jgi:hypothetical protein
MNQIKMEIKKEDNTEIKKNSEVDCLVVKREENISEERRKIMQEKKIMEENNTEENDEDFWDDEYTNGEMLKFQEREKNLKFIMKTRMNT